MVLCVIAGYYWLVTISGALRNFDSEEVCKSFSWIYHIFSNTGNQLPIVTTKKCFHHDDRIDLFKIELIW